MRAVICRLAFPRVGPDRLLDVGEIMPLSNLRWLWIIMQLIKLPVNMGGLSISDSAWIIRYMLKMGLWTCALLKGVFTKLKWRQRTVRGDVNVKDNSIMCNRLVLLVLVFFCQDFFLKNKETDREVELYILVTSKKQKDSDIYLAYPSTYTYHFHWYN